MEPKLFFTIRKLDCNVRQSFERLVKESQPRALRLHQLVKIFKTENPARSPSDLKEKIALFYSLPYSLRTENRIRKAFDIQPYPWLMQQLDLNFRNAAPSENAKVRIAANLSHQIQILIAPPKDLVAPAFLQLVIHRITNPRWDQPATGIDLPIFAKRWKAESQTRFKSRYRDFFEKLESAIEIWMREGSEQLPQSSITLNPTSSRPANSLADLKQTDLDWMKSIVESIENGRRLPLYPLQSGPKTPVVLQMERLVRAGHFAYPNRHRQLENTLREACKKCLSSWFPQQQSAESKFKGGGVR